MSHIEQQRQLFEKNKKFIKAILGWNHPENQEYEDLQLEKGFEYLNGTFDAHGVESLESDSFFWKWWINQWNLRDSYIVPLLIEDKMTINDIKYRNAHSLKSIKTFPDQHMIEESFAKMIGELNDSQNGSHV